MTTSHAATAEFHSRAVSAAQLRAVYAAMRIVLEDDLERGIGADAAIHCLGCRRDRPAPGSVRYDGRLLCNGCATDFEVLRLSGFVREVAGYLARAVSGARAE